MASKPTDIRNFKRSFRPIVLLKAGEVCSLKRHYYGALREVIGYLDKLAANDSERFVYPTVPDIVRHCNRYKNRKPYGQRIVEYAISYAQQQHVISKTVERERLGAVREGFIVTPHDSLAVHGKRCCEFKGMLRAPGHWESDLTPGNPTIWWAGPAGSLDSNAVVMLQRNHSNAVVTRPLEPESAGHSAVFSAAPSAVPESISAVQSAVSNENKCGDQCGNQCGTKSLQVSVNENDASIPVEISPRFPQSFPAPNRESLSHSTVKAERTLETEQNPGNQTQQQDQPQNPESGKAFLPKGMNDKSVAEPGRTIGEHFGFPWGVLGGDLIKSVTDGVLNTDTKQWQEFEQESEHDLHGCFFEAIKSMKDQPYRGRKTNAHIMDCAIKAFNKNGGKVPSSLFKVMKDFQRETQFGN